MMNRSDFGNYVVTKRKDLCLSQSKLAKLCGVSRQTISYYETGAVLPNEENYDKVIDVLSQENIRQTSGVIYNHHLRSEIAAKMYVRYMDGELIRDLANECNMRTTELRRQWNMLNLQPPKSRTVRFNKDEALHHYLTIQQQGCGIIQYAQENGLWYRTLIRSWEHYGIGEYAKKKGEN